MDFNFSFKCACGHASHPCELHCNSNLKSQVSNKFSFGDRERHCGQIKSKTPIPGRISMVGGGVLGGGGGSCGQLKSKGVEVCWTTQPEVSNPGSIRMQ